LLVPFYVELGVDVGTVAAALDRAPFSAEAAELLAEFRLPVVGFQFGLPADPLISRIRQKGVRILASATTVDAALWL